MLKSPAMTVKVMRCVTLLKLPAGRPHRAAAAAAKAAARWGLWAWRCGGATLQVSG